MPRPPAAASPLRSVLVAVLLAAALGCGPTRPPGFVLILVDTLRLDRLSFANPAAPATPAFDRLRDESVWFSRAYSTSSWTLPSVVSLLVSQLPSEHRVATWGGALASDRVTLPDVMRTGGYRTGMFTANRIVGGDRGIVQRFDLGRFVGGAGFTKGELHREETFADARAVSNQALGWLASVRSDTALPYLALVHYMDPHAPYPCPAEAVLPGCRRDSERLNRRLVRMKWEFSDEERSRIGVQYDAGIAAMDDALGRFLDELERTGVLDEAWVLLLSDHGELLGESDLWLHGRSLAEPLVRIPLLVRPPGGGPAREVDTAVSLVDLGPTLIALAGLAAPPAFRGRSLVPALEGASLPPQPVVVELPQVRPVADKRRQHVFALIEGDEKWLVGPDGSAEQRRLGGLSETAGAPREPAALEERLQAADVRFELSDYLGIEFAPPSEQMLDALRKVGYIE